MKSMKRIIPLILIVLLIIVISNTINAENEVSTLDFNLSCEECHANAYKYPKHLEGYSYCEECHGSDVHPIHSLDCKTCHQNEPITPFCHGADPDVVVPTSNGLICKACHQSNLVEVHESKCQLCHQNINEIHKEANVVGGVE